MKWLFLLLMASNAFSNSIPTCPSNHFCLTLVTPIQTGASNESYDLITTSIMTLDDGDRAIDRTELTVMAGEYFYDFADQPFRELAISIDAINHQPNENPVHPENCNKKFTHTMGNHLITIIKNEYDGYECDK